MMRPNTKGCNAAQPAITPFGVELSRYAAVFVGRLGRVGFVGCRRRWGYQEWGRMKHTPVSTPSHPSPSTPGITAGFAA